MRIQEHRGSRIDDVERLDDMLPLAIRIGRHARDIFEIDLPAQHGCRALHGLMQRLAALRDAIMAFEDAVNGLARGNGHLEELQQGVVF